MGRGHAAGVEEGSGGALEAIRGRVPRCSVEESPVQEAHEDQDQDAYRQARRLAVGVGHNLQTGGQVSNALSSRHV